MNLDEFTRDIRHARQRAAELYHHARESFVEHQKLLVTACEELYNALDNLEVIELNLHQQNEEIAAAYRLVELERQLYRDLFESVPDAFLVTDAEGIIRECNCAATKLLNVSQPFLVGKPLAIFVTANQRRTFRLQLNRLRQLKFVQKWEMQLLPRNREPIDVAVTVNAIFNSNGMPFAFSWLLRDITQDKQQQSALALLISAVQHANEAVVITSAQLNKPGPKIVFVNPTFTKMTGYTLEEITGKTPRILQGTKTDRSVLDRLRQSLSQGKMFYGELINYHKNGSEYTVQSFCTPIWNEQGEATHFLSIQRNMTT